MKFILALILLFLVFQNSYAGSWGYAPDESVEAMDLLLRLEDGEDFSKLMEEALNKVSYDENGARVAYAEDGVRGMCDYMVNEIGSKNSVSLDLYIETCLSRLKKMLENPEYIESWGKANLIIEAINRQITELNLFKEKAHSKN